MRYLILCALLAAISAAPAAAQVSRGDQAPEIEADAWFNQPPGTSLGDLRGRVIFLEFWATW